MLIKIGFIELLEYKKGKDYENQISESLQTFYARN